MDKRQNRRQWLRGLSAGSAAVGMGALTNCGSGRNQSRGTESNQSLTSFGAKIKAATPVQIICHGMLAFQLDSKNQQLLIHIPAVDAGDDSHFPHEYWAGAFQSHCNNQYQQLATDETYTMSGATAAADSPADLKRT